MALTCLIEVQQTRTRQRSRFGCRNCKLRKLKVRALAFQKTRCSLLTGLTWPIKCDESKPNCKRCSSFGVLCNFMSGIPDLQPVAADTRGPWVVRRKADIQPSLTNAVWTADASTTYQLNAKCQDFVTRYLGRSLITPDDPNMIQVNRKLLELAFHVS